MEELKRQIEELTKRVETMEMAQNLDMNALILDGLFSEKGDYGADLKRTVSIPVGGGSFVVPEDPINSLKINYNGTKYRILLYSLS